MLDLKTKLRKPQAHREFKDISARRGRVFLRSSLALLMGLGLMACSNTATSPTPVISDDPLTGGRRPSFECHEYRSYRALERSHPRVHPHQPEDTCFRNL